MSDSLGPWDTLPMPSPAEMVAASVVRELIDRNEREIEGLLVELGVALREAREAELHLAQHPRVGDLEAGPPRELARRTEPTESIPARAIRRQAPRTTVVSRPRTPSTPTIEHAGGATEEVDPPPPDRPPAPTGPRHAVKRERAGRLGLATRSNALFKIGVAVTLVALLLLKFG